MVVEVDCDYCGTTTEKYPYQVERRENLYCSPECSSKAQANDPLDQPVQCDVCGGEIDRSPAQIQRRGDSTYCSPECHQEARWDAAETVETECAGCGDTFTIPESRVNHVHFCSDDCEATHSKTCPECGESGFKNLHGVKMHYTRTHGESFDRARLEAEYGTPLGDLLERLHWDERRPIYEVADKLDVSRDWVKQKLNESGAGHRSAPNGSQQQTHLLLPDSESKYGDLLKRLRRSLDHSSWPRQSRRFRAEAGECEVCGAESESEPLHTHHIIPIRYGGLNEAWNLMALCRDCHTTAEAYSIDVLESVLD